MTFAVLLAMAAALVGCGGRAWGIFGDSSGAHEGGSSGATSSAPEGSTGEASPDSSLVDSPDNTAQEGSNGEPATVIDSGTDPTGDGESDGVITCGPAAGGIYFVDPGRGEDDGSNAGSRGCPFKSVTHALSLVGDAGASVTIEIINTSGAPTLSEITGEVFPIMMQGGVTITAEDTTKNTPTVEVTTSALRDSWDVPGCAPPCPTGFSLRGPNALLSHVNLIYSGSDFGVGVVTWNGGIDHVSIRGFLNRGILGAIVNPLSGSPNVEQTIGPGVVVTGASIGLEVSAGAALVTGGQGEDHTSFTGSGNAGIQVDRTGTLRVDGAPIDPAKLGTSDVDVDGNTSGLFLFGAGTITGLHVSGNMWGVGCNGCSLTMRDSYIGSTQLVGVEAESPSIDLGTPTDYGRNIFLTNAGGDICDASQGNVSAVGNIFGTVDCALGGKLDPSVTCGGVAGVDVSRCTF